uniref:Neurotransmitter-gated ion-channel ligand-binding domain-containing protein n=1 Tax=Panagrolaimus sp. JU765 TaxID=591449 RepID=A0AC34QFF8_9BILA
MINHIEKVDEKEQTILLHGQLSASWKDEYLTWNPADYNGTAMIAIDSWYIWQPSFALYNSARSNGWYLYMQGVPATVISNGRVYATGSFSFHITCYFDFADYPYDVQKCPIVIADWVYDLSKINLSDPIPTPLTKPVIRLSFDPAEDGPKKHVAGWEVQDTWRKHCYWGPSGCSTELPNGPLDSYWSLLEFGLVIKRHAAYYGLTVVLPTIVTVSLTLTVFWIDDYPIAMAIAMFDVLLQGLCSWSLLKVLPPSNGQLPRIAYFCAYNFILAALAYCIHAILNFLLEVLPGDIELPFQLTNFTEKLREIKFFKIEGLSFDPQKVLLGEDAQITPDPFETPAKSEPNHHEAVLVEMDDPSPSSTIETLELKVENSPEAQNEDTNASQNSLKPSISNESHLAEEMYTLRRIIFVFYLLIYLVLIPWLLL